MNSNLQVYGRNADAQQIAKDQIDAAFPALEQQFDITGQILQKFYDWAFPFMYTEDGGATMTWTASVRSWITRNAKLSQLEELFENSGTDGTFTETYGGNDTETFTDNHATERKTEFSGVNETLSGALADKITNSPVSGKNTEERKTAYGRTRTYADGRNWTEVMNDITRAEEPVYTFINSFARLLVSPDWRKERFCDVLPPSVEMEVQTETLPSGSAATAEIENRGTPFNADWLLSPGIPTGAAGQPGPDGQDGQDGKAALTYGNLYFSSTVPPVTIIQEISKFNRTPEVGDMCLFPVFFTGSSPDTRPVYIVCGKCSAVDSAYATFTTVNYALIGGENGTDGQDGNDPNAVHFTEQTLNAEEQAQARTNIGAASTVDLAPQTTNVYAEISANGMFAYVYAHIVMQRWGNKANIHMDFRIDLRSGNPAVNWTLFTTSRLCSVLGLTSLEFIDLNTRVVIENGSSSYFGTVGGNCWGYTGLVLGFDSTYSGGIGIGRLYNQPSNNSVGCWEVTEEEVYNEDYIYHADIWGADVS